MPAVPVSLFDPVREQFSALLPPAQPAAAPAHPLGRHRRRIPDRAVFEHAVAAPVHGSGDERIATPGCPDRSSRRRVRAGAEAGPAQALHALVLAQCDRMIGLELSDPAVDGRTTKAPCGGETAGRSPVDRGKQGPKRATATDAAGVPLRVVSAGANRHDAPLLLPAPDGPSALGLLPAEATVHLDRAFAGGPTRAPLDQLGLAGAVARKGVPAPVRAGRRWVVERTRAWTNGDGKRRRCTEESAAAVDSYPFPAAAFVVARRLIRRARRRYRRPSRPTSRRLK